ncbi:MAG: hypothetical protein SH817_10315 [Leptospira sp.]|nr:hypothetical protein [Leptospira sp.]
MKSYLELTRAFMKRGVSSNSNFRDFHKKNNEILSDEGNSRLTEFQSFLVLQNMVWLEWCYTQGHSAIFKGEFSSEEQEYKTAFFNNEIGLSMKDAIIEKIHEETPFKPIQKDFSPTEQPSGENVTGNQLQDTFEGSDSNERTPEN